MKMHTCPTCKGATASMAFINRGEDISTHSLDVVSCLTCHGTGEITDGHLSRIKKGKDLRKCRIAIGETLRVAASRMGISPVELSAIENGREIIKP